MSPSSEDPRAQPPAQQVTEIFDACLAAIEAGRPSEADELAARAGPHAEELRARLRAFRSVSDLAARAALPPQAQFGSFRILSALGSGGQSSVHLAHDGKLGREVALKLLDLGGRLTSTRRAWVLREARALARLDHPGVVRVLEVAEIDGSPVLVMEHIAGPSLSELLRALRALAGRPHRADEAPGPAALALAREFEPLRARVELLRRIAQAVAYCHERGVLHRDLKPHNILLRGTQPVLIDLGLSHLAADADSEVDITSRLVGTPAYIAPEQVESGRTGADPRSDQFSLSVIGFELLTRANPFHLETRSLTLDAICMPQTPPVRSYEPAVPAELARVIEHGLAHSPEGRYPSVAALEADLANWLHDRPISVASPSGSQRARLWLRRHRRGVTSSAAALALVASGLTLSHLRHHWQQRTGVLKTLERDALFSDLSAAGFHASFHELTEARVQAADHDEDWLAPRLLGPLASEVDRACDEWSAFLRRRMDEELGGEVEDEAARSKRRFAWSTWVGLTDLERVLNPRSTLLDTYRTRQHVRYPAVGENECLGLSEHVNINLLSSLRSIESLQTALPAGVYRLVKRSSLDGRLLAECDFAVRELEPERVLALEPPSAPWIARMVGIEEGEFNGVRPEPYYLMRDPLRWSDLASLPGNLGARIEAAAGNAPRAEFVETTWPLALEAASSVGLRLPTKDELFAAYKAGAITEPTVLADVGRFAEFSASIGNGSPAARMLVGPFEDFAALDVSEHDNTSVNRARASGKQRVGVWGFRFACSAPLAERRR